MQPNGRICGYFSFSNVKAACMFASLSAMTTKNYEFLAQNRRGIAKTYFFTFLEALTKILNEISSRFGY